MVTAVVSAAAACAAAGSFLMAPTLVSAVAGPSGGAGTLAQTALPVGGSSAEERDNLTTLRHLVDDAYAMGQPRLPPQPPVPPTSWVAGRPLPPLPAMPPPNSLPFWPAFGKTLINVGVAEIFDKTWFVTLFLAIAWPRWVCFCGSYFALALHVFIAAGLGVAIAQIPGLHPATLNFIAAGVLALFAAFYAYESYTAEEDEDVMDEYGEGYVESVKKAGGESYLKSCLPAWAAAGALTFFAVFLAEWGDRTQLVMVALHASQPLWAVVFASLLAFLLLCASAVLLASAVAMLKLKKRTINGLVAVSFVIFTALAVYDGVRAMHRGLQESTDLHSCGIFDTDCAK